MSIPVIDFSAYSLRGKDVTEEQMTKLSKGLNTAFTEVGFVFLKNTMITQEEVDRVMDITKKFFEQPDELKQPFSTKNCAIHPSHGWLPVEAERLNQNRPEDKKESFDVASLHPDVKWPSGPLAEFREIQTYFFHRCKDLGLQVITVMAHSLGLDPEVLLSAHRFVGTDKNCSMLRTLNYPSVHTEKVKKDQLRCGEHTDFGSITMLFQNNEGLQLHQRSSGYIDVPVIPGAVLINIGDLMQRWTSDQFVSTPHRVLLPPAGDFSTRQSLAFFLDPDDEALITCMDGSNKYPPIKAGAYINQHQTEVIHLSSINS